MSQAGRKLVSHASGVAALIGFACSLPLYASAHAGEGMAISAIWLALATAMYLLHVRIQKMVTLVTLWGMWVWTLPYLYDTGLSRPGFGHGVAEWIAHKQTLDAYADAILLVSMIVALFYLVTASRRLANAPSHA